MSGFERGLLLSFFTLWASAAPAANLRVDPEASVLAVVTHKAGLAAKFAHDHFISAGNPILEIRFDQGAPERTEAELRLAVTELIVDDPAARKHWYPHLERLGVLDAPYGELSDKDRGKIREAMLGPKQLEADTYPEILAEISGIREEPSSLGATEFPYAVDLSLTVRGESVTRPLAARYETSGGAVSIEAVGTFDFTDLGIKPFSAMMGTVRNRNTFHLYVYLRLIPEDH